MSTSTRRSTRKTAAECEDKQYEELLSKLSIKDDQSLGLRIVETEMGRGVKVFFLLIMSNDVQTERSL